ncbi:MAG: hypothetical protein LUG86_08990 [Oscillospiraceae bacterium]|nr:hypothetical protein [Oscillospiraceae bacterium]
MGRKVRAELRYKKFYNTLKMSDFGYTDEDIRTLFRSVREMDDESRGWVISWINGKGLPKATVEGVTAKYLVDEVKMQPVNALIALDWLKHEPETAKFYILRLAKDDSENEAAMEKMKKIVEELKKDKDKRLGDPEGENEAPENIEEMVLDGIVDQS